MSYSSSSTAEYGAFSFSTSMYTMPAVPRSANPLRSFILVLQERDEEGIPDQGFPELCAPKLVRVEWLETSPDQAWYWTPGWQAQEQEAESDLCLGRYQDFETMDGFIDSLGELATDE